jgi:FkbM family methyltransferase
MTHDPASGNALGGRSRFTAGSDGKDLERVEVVAIDEVVPKERTVSVIHLDVEGFEQEALTGALARIQKDRPLLILETVPDEEWLAHNLYPLGYKKDGMVCHNTIYSV